MAGRYAMQRLAQAQQEPENPPTQWGQSYKYMQKMNERPARPAPAPTPEPPPARAPIMSPAARQELEAAQARTQASQRMQPIRPVPPYQGRAWQAQREELEPMEGTQNIGGMPYRRTNVGGLGPGGTNAPGWRIPRMTNY